VATAPRRRSGRARRWGPFAAGLIALVGLVWWVSHSPIFELRDLRIRGNHHLSSDQVARLAGLTDHSNLVWMSIGGVERRLEANPWVDDARISRTLPSALVVEIRERSAVAVAGDVLVAKDGTVLGPAGPSARLPILTGVPGTAVRGRLVGAVPQLTVVREVPAQLLGRVERIELEASDGIAVQLRGGIQVRFGDASDAGEKWDALASILTWCRTHDVAAGSVDVRVPSSPAMRPDQGSAAAAASG
jgi:cell division protein FtsQ